jgi:hypothetical protein
MLNDAIAKLEKEMEDNKENGCTQYVGKYIVEYMNEHPDRAEKILAEGKTLVGSMKHMEGVARKKKNRGAVVLSDAEGFRVVLEYYGIDDKELPDTGKAKAKRKVDISLDDLF